MAMDNIVATDTVLGRLVDCKNVEKPIKNAIRNIVGKYIMALG